MNAYTFSIHVTYNDYLNYYSGAASTVLVVTDNGLKLQLPASRLRPYLTQLGIKGRFRLTVNADNKFQQLEKLA
ncbi:hypothetical protein ABT56_17535 [Photobacterium aquae]|uniref:DUF2835 domain-containing protein n=1 Tax=Photobacterium aquae TaxID=1195763 RepID=A0A0J1GVX3_9GAMM|nr:DUF2835 domain-containing protein [Photobacterium aquae]KLV03776.1 hypothetical protein ABT56_17535 [Photobacterium aquae]